LFRDPADGSERAPRSGDRKRTGVTNELKKDWRTTRRYPRGAPRRNEPAHRDGGRFEARAHEGSRRSHWCAPTKNGSGPHARFEERAKRGSARETIRPQGCPGAGSRAKKNRRSTREGAGETRSAAPRPHARGGRRPPADARLRTGRRQSVGRLPCAQSADGAGRAQIPVPRPGRVERRAHRPAHILPPSFPKGRALRRLAAPARRDLAAHADVRLAKIERLQPVNTRRACPPEGDLQPTHGRGERLPLGPFGIRRQTTQAEPAACGCKVLPIWFRPAPDGTQHSPGR